MICTATARDPEESLLPLPLLRAVWGGGERAGRMRHWRLPDWTAMTIVIVTVWAKKRGWTREKERGNLKMGFFHAVLFCNCFLAFIFQCRLIDFLSRSIQLLDGLLLQDFSLSHSNSVVELLFIKFKSTVYWLSLARFLFQSSKFGHYISVWQL